MSTNIIASLDLGGNKITCMIGYINSLGKLCIKGVGHKQSNHIKNGVIIDIRTAYLDIISTISIAEKMAGYNIKDIAVNISGSNIQSNIITVDLNINGNEITYNDIILLKKNVQKIFSKDNKYIIHLIPLNYSLDQNEVIENPVGMIGQRMSATFNVVVCDLNIVKNISNCIRKTPITITNFVVNQYASALSFLSEKETQQGSLVIDFGAQNTSFAIFKNGNFIYGNSIGVAGDIITNDISKILNLDKVNSEKVKVLNTDFSLSEKELDENIAISVNDETYNAAKNKKIIVNEIVKSRINEIIHIISNNITENNLSSALKNIYITGGGANIVGLESYLSDILGINVKVGYPKNLTTGNSIQSKELELPIYSSSVGILRYLERIIKNKQEQTRGNNFINKIINFFIN